MADDLGGSPLKRKVSQIRQYIYSMSITSILYTEGNTGGIINIPIIEVTFENDYIHILHDIPKQYIYGYLIPRPIILEATIHSLILKIISLILLWAYEKKHRNLYWAYQLIFSTHKPNYSLIWYWSNGDYDPNMHYLWSLDINFSTNYQL